MVEFSEEQINEITRNANVINADTFKKLRDSHFKISVNYNPDLDHRYSHYPPMSGEIYRAYTVAIIQAMKELTDEASKESPTTNPESQGRNSRGKRSQKND